MQHHIETLKSYLPGLVRGFGSQNGLKLVFCGNVEAFANGISCSANDALAGILPAGCEGHDACVAAIAALVVASKEQDVEFDTGRFDRSTEQNPNADTENRYAATGELVGNDVIRMIAAIVSTSFGPEYLADSNSSLVQDLRKELLLYSPAEIAWEPFDSNASGFNPRFERALAEVVCSSSHPSAGDSGSEGTLFLAGRIGNLAVRSIVSVFDNGECGEFRSFIAKVCANEAEAVVQCRAWGDAEVREYLNESIRVALDFAGRILGRGDRDTNVGSFSRHVAAQFAGELSEKPMSEDAITGYFLQQIDDGSLDAESMARLLAVHGLMDPASFLLEMRERQDTLEEELAKGRAA